MNLSAPTKFILFSILFTVLGILLAFYSTSFQTASAPQQQLLDGLSASVDRERDILGLNFQQSREDLLVIAQSPVLTQMVKFFSRKVEEQRPEDLQKLKKDLSLLILPILQEHPAYLKVALFHADPFKDAIYSTGGSQNPTLPQQGLTQSLINEVKVLNNLDILYSSFHLDQKQGRQNSDPKVLFELLTPVRIAGNDIVIVSIKIDLGVLAQNLHHSSNPERSFFIINSAGDYLLHSDSQKLMRVEFAQPVHLLDDYPIGALNRHFKGGEQKDFEIISRRINTAMVGKHLSFDSLNPGRKIAIVAVSKLN